MRIDAMHTGYETREVMKNIDDVHMKIRASQQKSQGMMRIKQLPNGCTANDIRAYIKEYEIHIGRKVDAILVDYLDLMFPMSKKISAENLFVKDKYVTEELRNLAVELDILCVSASQLNRGSYEEIEFDPSHIAGGISKVNTADNVIGIFTSASMKEGGRYQIQFMKTRSSSGVGSKVDLAFNNKSLRISDLDENDDNAITAASKNIYDTLKKKSVVKSGEKLDTNTGEITSMTQQDRKVDTLEGAASLRAFLKKR
jgi:replicative DNA helicase